MNKECYYCGQIKSEEEGFMFCDEFVCNECENELGENKSGDCSCACILSGHCDESC